MLRAGATILKSSQRRARSFAQSPGTPDEQRVSVVCRMRRIARRTSVTGGKNKKGGRGAMQNRRAEAMALAVLQLQSHLPNACVVYVPMICAQHCASR